MIIAAVFAYSGVAAFGTPAFLLLRASKRTAFWIAPALGFAVGVATWLVFIVLFRSVARRQLVLRLARPGEQFRSPVGFSAHGCIGCGGRRNALAYR